MMAIGQEIAKKLNKELMALALSLPMAETREELIKLAHQASEISEQQSSFLVDLICAYKAGKIAKKSIPLKIQSSRIFEWADGHNQSRGA